MNKYLERKGIRFPVSLQKYQIIYFVFVYLFIATILAWGNLALADTSREFVKDIRTGEPAKFSSVLRKLDTYISQSRSPRRQFESSADYQSRLSKNREVLEKFLEIEYSYIGVPRRVHLDWRNLLVKLDIAFPLVIMRTRGGPDDSNLLSLGFSVDEGLARQFSAFQEQCSVSVVFSLTREKAMHIKSINVLLNGEGVYNE